MSTIWKVSSSHGFVDSETNMTGRKITDGETTWFGIALFNSEISALKHAEPIIEKDVRQQKQELRERSDYLRRLRKRIKELEQP